MENEIILKVKDLTISFRGEDKWNSVVKDISFNLKKNEILGIVGESGSGKSVTSLAVMGLLPKDISRIDNGFINFLGENLGNKTATELSNFRGKEISMVFQEPMSSLNPSMKCGRQVEEILYRHTDFNSETIKAKTLELFTQVKLPDPGRVYSSYPHEISGGQKQRVVIALAIACKPKILIADEPTTALDVTVQKEVIKLLKELQSEVGMSIIFVSHDLALVSEIADKVIVMYKGEIVESGNTENVFRNPQNTYTKALINSRPRLDVHLKRLPTIQDFLNNNPPSDIITKEERSKTLSEVYAQPPLLEVVNVGKTYISKAGFFSKPQAFTAIEDVSFKIYEGETLGLVGESGCGKSTLGNAILQLDKASTGKIIYRGKDITNLSKSDLRKLRKEIQIIFQDPYASLNPRIQVGTAIMEPMKVHGIGQSDKNRKLLVMDLMKKVGLHEDYFYRYPHEFSGGQRQRIGIARTIALQPKLIVCDESVSALDISVQAQVLNLLNDLKEDLGFTYIFISHDLAVVKYMSDQLVVMNNGHVEEMGDSEKIYADPQKEYTKKLIHAIPKGR